MKLLGDYRFVPSCGMGKGFKGRTTVVWRGLKPFLRLTIHPLKGAWNLLSVGLPGALAAVLWGFNHPALAVIVVLATFLVLVTIAGVRVQNRLDRKTADQGFLDSLGRQLDLGRWELDAITYASDEFHELLEGIERGRPLSDSEKSDLNDRMKEIMDKPTELEWSRKVRERLSAHLPDYYSALFDSPASLIPAPAPKKVIDDDYWRDRWTEQEMRLQRLHKIIEDLHREWRPRWSP